jgi:predicted transglutaminase-like cysteine proteinase
MDKLERENASTDEKVDRVNAWFNRQVIWQSDDKVWKTNDYWATPIETIGRSKGDCEDFCIAKYYSLLSLGVSMKKLRLVYVKAKTSTGEQAHMVLAYYPSPDAEPMILDNLVTSIRSAGRRPDLSPVFSFNGEGVYSGTSSESKGGAEKLSRWQDLMKRTRDEGFN